jgi:putative ABC transport system permease protein
LVKLIDLGRTALFIVLVMLSLLFLPVEFALLAIIFLVAGFILWDALRNRILFKMSVRSVLRRKSTTALVLGGLMVGTAIIASSFVVGDTLDNMIVGEVTKGAGYVDYTIGARTTTGMGAFNESYITPIVDQLAAIDHVDAVDPIFEGYAGLRDNTSSLQSSNAAFLGLTPALVDHSGGFTDTDGNKLTAIPAGGHVYMNQKMAKDLDAHQDDELLVLRGTTVLHLTIDAIVQDKNLGGYMGESLIFMDLASAQALAGVPGQYNYLLVSLDDSVGPTPADTAAVREQVNQTLAGYPDSGLKILFDKSEELADGREQMSQFTSLFLVMGSFSIIAGIALVINIFTMLSEERKSEMGMARAIGMKRVHLRKLFTYEGMIYALLAAGIGAVVGVVLAYFIIIGISMVIDTGGIPLDQYFTFTPFSVTIAYTTGFLLTIAVVYLTTYRISNMNIVRAVRNIPEPPVHREDRKAFRMGLAGVVGGVLLTLLGIMGESLAPSLAGLSLIFLSVGLLLRKYVGDRWAWNVTGLASLIVWLPLPFDIFPYEGNIEMFAVAGVFMVTSVLILVIANSDQIIGFLTRLLRVKGGYIAVVKTAISYPLKAKFRTALSIFIFGLVIFTVTTLSMMSGILAVGVPKMINETSGGFDIIGFSNPMTPVTTDLWGDINASQGNLQKENITDVISLYYIEPWFVKGVADDANPQEQFRYGMIGFDHRFFTEGDYPLKERNQTLYATDEDAWNAVLADDSLCIIDGSGTAQMSFDMAQASSLSGLGVGDQLTVQTTAGANKTMTIVGITKQSAFGGVFVANGTVQNEMMVQYPDLFMLKVAPGADVDRQAINLEKDYLANGMTTISMAAIAKDATAQIDGVFNLLKAFLAMGLIIGISGLGIITIRSINERRIEIGMMRAIGYTRRMVIANFAMESSFISVIGILGGTVLGIIVGYSLWESAFQPMDMDFVIAWGSIAFVGLAAFAATLLCVLPAARGASRVSPAEVLRFE